jgi:hypothetical protein
VSAQRRESSKETGHKKEMEKRKEKRKKWNRMMEQSGIKLLNAAGPGRVRRLRRFQTSKPWLIFLAFQHILDANRLTWSDVGHHSDCQFTISIHTSQQQEPI